MTPRATTGDDTSTAGDEPGFADALSELERIVAELESDALDIDHLAERVERAASLVQVCRDRIGGARFSVEAILERDDAEGDGA
jgi:exodeoxyribonuclease VII small subunit